MKMITVVGAATLLALLGFTVPVVAQDDHQKDADKPASHEEAAKPAAHEETAKPATHEEAKPAKQEEQPKPEEHPQAKAQPQPKPEDKPVKAAPAKSTRQPKQEQAETQQTKTEHSQPRQAHAERTSAEVQRQHAIPALRLSVRGSGRIPDDRFRANFGVQHRFVISQPQIVGGYSRFQYGGFWFGFVQPWPDTWYYTDDVYVDYIDGGYYLYNPYYPDDRVSISVVL